MRARCTVLGLVAALLVAAPAHAQETATPHHMVALEWRAPQGCPTAQDLRIAIAHALDWSPFTPGGLPELSLTGEAHPVGDVWSISLSLTTIAGEALGRRELVSESSSCAEALDSVALVAAMMIESPRIDARLRTPAPALPFGGLVLAARLGVAFDFLVGPTVAYGPRVEISLTPPGAWAILASATFFPETYVRSPGLELKLTFVAVALGVCPALLNTRDGSVSACGGLDLLYIEATRTGDPTHDSSDVVLRPWLGARGELRLVGPLRAGISAEVAVPLAAGIRYESEGVVKFAMPPVNLATSVWLALQIP